MTTKTMERGRVKCHQYWESTVDESSVYGNFAVKTTSIDSNEDYTVASLEIKNSKVGVMDFHVVPRRVLTLSRFISDWWNQKRITLAIYELAGLRGSIFRYGDVNISAACSWETSRDGECSRWYLGWTPTRATNYRSLQRWYWQNRSENLEGQSVDEKLNIYFIDFRNIYNTWYLHIATGGCWNRWYSWNGREDSSSTSLFHSDARSICILPFGAYRVCLGPQAS